MRGEARPILVSACLVGVRCRYDGQERPSPGVLRLFEEGRAVAVCPEELGGLGTPRPAAGLEGGGGADVWQGRARVVNRLGVDVTEAFQRGAREALRQARECGAKLAILKQHSPSCGVGSAGSVDGTRIPADGVAAALLRGEGIQVISDEEFEKP